MKRGCDKGREGGKASESAVKHVYTHKRFFSQRDAPPGCPPPQINQNKLEKKIDGLGQINFQTPH